MKKLKALYRKLVPLRGQDTTARVTLERTLDKVERIKGVLLVIQWDDDTFDCDWSAMKTSELAMACLILQEQAKRCVVSER